MKKEKDLLSLKKLKDTITSKQVEKILSQPLITTREIYLIIPSGYPEATRIKNKVLEEMKNRRMYISDGKRKMLSTKILKEMLNI